MFLRGIARKFDVLLVKCGDDGRLSPCTSRMSRS
ncbi:hypothetical protein JMJ77_0009436 [Colletotrichum scovillei]|uniref:Uncharacterized protein n=1 Tax=Colletotrichum scovillei TaxID=1209932 RepID=A0A9P7QY67_9PEZI|nr:hypothetical protein JMJ77_0009436 [Colletotrichum scovillei]KAG7052516.1 hypothetical protein JMJ78_0005532 [Colletotrichum scovillei]KAG7064806.1 hypothetical protein JMJ76_0012564 [Colletotrichum scovillei]